MEAEKIYKMLKKLELIQYDIPLVRLDIQIWGLLVRNYSWYEYSCPAGYEGPFEKGFDCEGTKDVCNSPILPQNNCKKPISLNSTYETNKTYRDLELHPVIGDVSIGDYGSYKDLICGNECNFNIKKITGENSDICFYKNNGFKECITVRGCFLY